MTLYRKLTMALVATVAAGIFAATASAAAPTNTTQPTISGTERQGRTLTATNGTWTGNPSSFSYRWQRCDRDGTSCGNIDNAASKSYTLTSNDVGHTVRIVVSATNSDGTSTANSKPTGVISGNAAPQNTTRPAISGTPTPGEELTASDGTWSNGVRTFAYQWARCDAAGATCVDIAGANGKTYGVRTLDLGHTLRVTVTATNLIGSTKAQSDRTDVVKPATPPTTTAPPPAANKRPTIAILSVRFAGARVYVRMRVCDDSRRNVSITERDLKKGVLAYTRHFRTLVPPRPCAALTRSWIPAPRFRHGRYTIWLRARDAYGLWSLRAASRTFVR